MKRRNKKSNKNNVVLVVNNKKTKIFKRYRLRFNPDMRPGVIDKNELNLYVKEYLETLDYTPQVRDVARDLQIPFYMAVEAMAYIEQIQS